MLHVRPPRGLLRLVPPALLAACALSLPLPVGGGPACTGPEVPLPRVCGADLQNPRISCGLPADVEGGLAQPALYVRQRASDLFSWQTFIALNWPALAGRRGEPDAAKPVSAPGPRVWETWKEITEVFRQKDGQPIPPEPWDAPSSLPASCQGTERFLMRDEKVDDEIDAVVQPTYADGTRPGTLTDQAGRRVRYEILLNRTAFESIVRNRLWDGRVQNVVNAVVFPPGSQIVKAAWKEVDGAAAERFQSMDACLCEEGPGGAPTDCRPQRMGLVGFHIMTKTPSSPQWIWSTFEQVDNVTSVHGAPASFNNPACPGCVPNRQAPAGFPNQTTRRIPIPAQDPDCGRPEEAVDNIAQLNRDLEKALAGAGSVLSRYELVSTQWPYRAAAGQPATVFEVRPQRLGNTTLETYIQENSSCMGCHAVAGTNRRDAWVSADFTFSLNDAYPNPDLDPTNPPPGRVPRGQRIIPPPVRPDSEWARAHWNDIVTGYRIATETYELVPAHVGSKLHCSSCHLGGGRDPQAAWWVGMFKKYGTLENLYARINQCFERSENGSAICGTSTGDSSVPCKEDPTMRALITYLYWLDAQWADWKERTHYTGPTPNGFPPLPATPSGKASAQRGGSIFQQKCAFCHGAEGQGRYLSDTYYRPALWGPDSFNAQAGLGSNLQDLAAFLHANMPYGNAGALTVQEAWDVACFVDAQSRPGKPTKSPADTPCSTTGSP
ncbi:MAG TPA: c-type cytochrome [Thermoanaerobaculia bacterium]|nr:c-type cytochrome [Thermoanaerobaculia bacterium]